MISVIRKQNPQNYWYTLVLGSVNKWLPTLYEICLYEIWRHYPIFEYEFIFEINETLFNDNHSVIKWRKVKSAWQKSAYFFYWPSNNVLVFLTTSGWEMSYHAASHISAFTLLIWCNLNCKFLLAWMTMN